MKEFDGLEFYNTLTSGAINLIGSQDELNKINVFPVADGDTGTNLASTMRSILEMSRKNKSISESAKSIADAALIGSRGNSGAIFAQYLHGIRISIGDKNHLTTSEIPEIFINSVDYAYKAVMEPVEGTILTIIRVWSESLYNEFQKMKDIFRSFNVAYEKASEALLRTKEQLVVLKKANVVDAGAKGFLVFIEGMGNYLKSGKSPDLKFYENKVKQIDHTENHTLESEITNRYCTEALIKLKTNDVEELKKTIKRFGDSIVFVNNDEKARIHVHTNTPADFFYKIKDYGDIIQQKADDMHMQYQVSQNRKYNIALVTDSACDIPEELIDKYQIQMIPLQLNFGPVGYLDKLTIKPEQFYKMFADTTYYPTSSQPNIRKFQNLYSFMMSHYDKLIAIHLSSRLSGTFNLSRTAAENYLSGNKKVTIMDSKVNSGAQGLLIEEAAEMIEKGIDYDDIVHRLSELIKKAKILVSVKSLDGMVRGGRVSPVKGLIAKIINLKPVISLDSEGNSELYGKGFSDRANRKLIFNLFKKDHGYTGIKRYCITHANNLKEARLYEEIARSISGKNADYIYNLSPVIGAHSGIGAVSLSYIKN